MLEASLDSFLRKANCHEKDLSVLNMVASSVVVEEPNWVVTYAEASGGACDEICGRHCAEESE